MKFKCKLLIYPEHLHISQIVTGFIMLAKQGIIDLDIEVGDKEKRCISTNMIEVLIDDKIKVVYDVMDGYTYGNKCLDSYLKEVDYYFKRSYNEYDNSKYKYGYKIQPLGFNYHVSTENNILDKMSLDIRSSKGLRKIKESLIEKIQIARGNYRTFFVEQFEQLPYYNDSPNILFLARTWEPLDALSESENNERLAINDMRAKCIRSLKKEFRNRFIGGFTPNEYTINNYNDCISQGISTVKSEFMKQVKQSDICIATLGLHKSNGWKLGEYIAASKGIVTEKMYYDVPGDFKKGDNYLDFENVDQCIENVYNLIDNPQYLYNMKINNFIYYHKYLRPDKIVLNTLISITNDLYK